MAGPELIDNPDETGDLLRLGLHRLPIGGFPLLRSLAPVLASCDGAIDLGRGLGIVLPGLTAALTLRPSAPTRADSAPTRADSASRPRDVLDRARVVQPGDGPGIDVAAGGALIQLSRPARRQPGNDLQGEPGLAWRGVCRARRIGRSLIGQEDSARRARTYASLRLRCCGPRQT